MIKITTIFAAALIGLGLAAPVTAQEAGHTEAAKQHWSFAGIFGTYDQNQLQRGFQVFREVCASCHSARLLAFRNLAEEGGPAFSEGQVKELAAQYEVSDVTVAGGKRKALPADHWPSPFATELDARDANGGAFPPDMSVLAKARSIEDGFPGWVFNYFTTYAEGGPDYIHALLNAYSEEVPAGVTNSDGTPFTLPEGKYFNAVFPSNSIGMPPPLSDGQIEYAAAADGTTVPLTVEQYSKDVSAFLMWVAEPHLDNTKSAGFKVLAFLLLFAALMYLVKQRLWRKVH
ncbi:MAG: cytochrome c1 [Devosia nanyangense]|uniref:Cytochrome c1 n=1 Tax=Devosia nanyangense TaxID=1228055 RepID=A0A933NY97_9HYPH|nr:cytochrome c1 [Devosia nanyangense]